MPAQTPTRDLLSAAHGTEINWERVPQFLRGRTTRSATFVYLIGEENDGPVKIGFAADPIRRLRELQTGNPRRLRIECLIFGNATTESLLHGYLQPHVIPGKRTTSELNPTYNRETEWFKAEARDEIIRCFIAIASDHLAVVDQDFATDIDLINEALGDLMTELGYEIRLGDTVHQLAKSGGYVDRQLR